jgi:hypothetical protein
VRTGAAWQFLKLQKDVVTMDIPEYFVDNLPKIMGILRYIVESAQPGEGASGALALEVDLVQAAIEGGMAA